MEYGIPTRIPDRWERGFSLDGKISWSLFAKEMSKAGAKPPPIPPVGAMNEGQGDNAAGGEAGKGAGKGGGGKAQKQRGIGRGS